MKNEDFLKVISNSFNEFLESGTSRSTQKLKPLHGAIARDLADKMGEGYFVVSQGYGDDKEGTISGRYFDKYVDITIKKGANPVCGIAVKFVMQNYSQNSNNYFESMLGETANIRSSKNNVPYFQIFIILDKLPYYKRDKTISKWEMFTEHNIEKYRMLATDDVNVFFHTPNKTLIQVVHIPDSDDIKNKKEYIDYYKSLNFTMRKSDNKYEGFGKAVIINDYEEFRQKIYHTIMSL